MKPSHLILIHGLKNKPPAADLSRIWRDALSKITPDDNGLNLGAIGVTTSLVYWADLFYPSPLAAGDYESASDELSAGIAGAAYTTDNEWVESLYAKIAVDDDDSDDLSVSSDMDAYERIPLPKPVKKGLMRRAAVESHDYLFNERDIRDVILQRVQVALSDAPSDARIVILGHSMGTMIAYDALTYIEPARPVSGLMTVGSPLGLDEIQDELNHTRENGFPTTLDGEWVNVFDPFDVVARSDPRLANDFQRDGEKVITDVKEENWGYWRHSATKYFQGKELRQHLRRLLDRE